MTKQNGVDVWPNAAIWMRDELRSKVKKNHVSEFLPQILSRLQKSQCTELTLFTVTNITTLCTDKYC